MRLLLLTLILAGCGVNKDFLKVGSCYEAPNYYLNVTELQVYGYTAICTNVYTLESYNCYQEYRPNENTIIFEMSCDDLNRFIEEGSKGGTSTGTTITHPNVGLPVR